MSHTATELESPELLVSELGEEVMGESSAGSSCLRVISVPVVVVVLLARGRLVLIDTLFGRLSKCFRAEGTALIAVSALLSE